MGTPASISGKSCYIDYLNTLAVADGCGKGGSSRPPPRRARLPGMPAMPARRERWERGQQRGAVVGGDQDRVGGERRVQDAVVEGWRVGPPSPGSSGRRGSGYGRALVAALLALALLRRCSHRP